MNERNGKAVLKATSKVATRQSYRHARNGRPPKPQADGNDFTRKVRNVSRALERMQSSMISMMGPSMTSTPCLSLHRDLVQYLADEALHLSASRKFAKEESRRGDHYRLQGVHSGPRRSIQAQRVLIIAPEDTVSGSERPGMVMIDVDLRKQHWATARGKF